MLNKNSRIRLIGILLAVLMVFSLVNIAPVSQTTVLAATDNQTGKSMLGVNLEELADYSAGQIFVDVMKVSRKWGPSNAPWNENANTDAAGWPLEDAGVCVLSNTTLPDGNFRDIGGTYKLIFEGTATIPNSNAKFTVTNKIVTDGVTTADVNILPGADSVIMYFNNTTCNSTTGKGVRNVQLIKPGYLPDQNGKYQTFTNEFLKVIEPFSTLRMMDVLNTNYQNSGSFVENGATQWFSKIQKTWEDRRRPTDSTQASNVRGFGGISWEYIVELANLTKKDIWINIPINATDDYITGVAQLLNSTLDSSVNVYVEYSNEVWNWGFSQAQSNLYYANNDPKLTKYGQAAFIIRYAERSAHIALMFKDVFGANAMNNRIRCVLAWQQNNGGSFDDMLNRLKDTYPELGNPSDLFYAFSVAPYFCEPLTANCTSVTAIQDEMIKDSDSKRYDKMDLVATANKWKMKGGVWAYEGGPHHQGQRDVNLSTRIAANRDAKMKDIVVHDIQDNWWELGCKGFMYFNLSSTYGIWGCWGAVESYDNLNAPKYQALLQLSQTPLSDIVIYTPPGGLIKNEGFEEDLARWTIWNNNSSGIYSSDSLTYRSGVKSLKLSGKSSGEGMLQNISFIEPNTYYNLTFYTKGEKGNVSVNYNYNLGGWKDIKTIDTGVNSDWTLKTIPFFSGTLPGTGIFVMIKDSYNGAVYFDDFKLAADPALNVSPTPIVGATATPTPTVGETATPTPTPTAGATATPTPTVGETATPTPTVAATVTPTETPTAVPVSSVFINKSTATLKVNATLQLSVTISPSSATNKSVTWTSNNTKVATVSSTGKVTAKLPGTATILVKTVDGGKTATCKVTVTQPVSSVKLNKTILTLYKGKTYQLKVTINPSNASNKKVTWKSSNTKVATVNSTGKITAKGKGTAYLTVSSVDGKKTAKCQVVVK